MNATSTIRSYLGTITHREGPSRGARSQIKYKAMGQEHPGIQTNLMLPSNRLIIDIGSEEEPIVEAAKVGDPCLIHFADGKQFLILWTEALVSGPCEPGTGLPTPPISDTNPTDPVHPAPDDPPPVG